MTDEVANEVPGEVLDEAIESENPLAAMIGLMGPMLPTMIEDGEYRSMVEVMAHALLDPLVGLEDDGDQDLFEVAYETWVSVLGVIGAERDVDDSHSGLVAIDAELVVEED